ncbi:amino acid ABC transporter permease [Limnohabitans sp. Hippo4]|uniref:amino acid ABC transporter permease n=1 Tax=Limnohabitans sp. Hippo4 TaxID=1826167 RepID=UPI000D35619E|nr:ABC transporter permease subunit [Limnohabitans sp. Hippo4]PUE36176.1 amino acid ABC transporter permease [Limnohabitans sp. Hippo4]
MSTPPPPKRQWSWRSQAFRGLVYQILAILVLVLAMGYLMSNTFANMRARGIQSGFDFFLQPAGFGIGESLIEFDSSQSYLMAYVIGLTNTLRVALVGLVLATLLGTLIGIGRLTKNTLVKSLCASYVEVTRNIPLLLQLFMWYFAMTELLPPIESPLKPLAGVFFSKNGLQYPLPVWEPGHWGTLIGLCVGIGAWKFWSRHVKQHFEATGYTKPSFLPGLGLFVLFGVIGWLIGGAPSEIDIPEVTEINVVGGGSVTPEYLTLLIGLTVYTSGYIAEVVRAGIQSVSFGQHEAAVALGLKRTQELRLIQLPQAMRVIIPPLTSQYLNLIKNSSLAVAVGYPDLVSISSTALNQTGRAIECIALVMLIYLSLSLLTSALMNIYNRRVRIKDR